MRKTRVENGWHVRRIWFEHRTHGHQPPFGLQCLHEGLQPLGLISSEDAARKRLALRGEGDKATAAPLRGGENVCGFREKRHGASRNFATAFINWSTRRGSTGFHHW